MAPVQPSASVAATGLGIRYVGNWIYGYSGAVGADDSETDLINANSGSGIIVAEVMFRYAGTSPEGDNYVYRIRLNGEIVLSYLVDQTLENYAARHLAPIIIPPLTEVRLTAQNTTDGSTHNQAALLTGRVYGAE
jgi:hypothetical protein